MNEEKARLDHERDDGFERSIRKENFDFNITFVTTFEIEEKKWRSWKEIVFWRISPFVFFSFLVSQILPLGYFFPLTLFINIIRSRNTDGTIKRVLSISVGGRAW